MKKCEKSFLIFVGFVMMTFDEICDFINKAAHSTEE